MPLFETTSGEAARVAAQGAGRRYHKILGVLVKAPAAIFEVAQAISTPEHQVHDHQISTRFVELVRAGFIRLTGERRVKPSTGCRANVYSLTAAGLEAWKLSQAAGSVELSQLPGPSGKDGTP